MNNKSLLPPKIAAFLPDSDARAPFVTDSDGLFAVAGQHALYFLTEKGIEQAGMWYEIQYGSWNAKTRQLTVVWTAPDRESVHMTTEQDNPEKFMRVLTSRVDRALVATLQERTPSGAVLTASVRRRVDGELFSTVMAHGYLPPEEEELAAALESRVREEVGLDNKH